MRGERSRILNIVLKKNKTGRLTLLGFESYSKVVAIKIL